MKKRVNKLPVLPEECLIIDTHCHLDMAAYKEDLEEVIQRAIHHGVRHTITIGIDHASSQRAIELAQHHSCLSAAVGVHPHDVENVTPATYDTIGEMADLHRGTVVAYGEIGLDYVKDYSATDTQRRHFANQLSLARNLNFPVIIHDRGAHDDTLRLLRESGIAGRCGGVMHCFSGDLSFARQVIDLGFYVSLPGVVTFKNAHDLQEVATNIPLSTMMVETDGPFLTPHPMRGKRNEPVNVLHTAAFIANLRGTPLAEIARQTTANSCRLFGLTL